MTSFGETGFESGVRSPERRALLDIRRLLTALTTRVAAVEALTTPTEWTAIPGAAGVGVLGGAWTNPEYCKVGDRIHLRGALNLLAGFSADATLATMPSGFRPPADLPGFACHAAVSSTVAVVRIVIYSSGKLSARSNGLSSGDYVSLDGVSYSVAA